MQQHVFHPPKIFSSYIGRRHKKKFVRNKCSKFLLMSFLKFFNYRKRHMAMQKKTYWKKWASVQDIENNWYLDACHEKKREKKKEKKEKKIAHVL
jgi:hypothetical protein